LTACTPGSAPGPTLGNEYGKTLPFTFLPAIWKARPRMKGVETMMTELGKLKEFAVFSIDELRDEEMADWLTDCIYSPQNTYTQYSTSIQNNNRGRLPERYEYLSILAAPAFTTK